VNALRGTSSMMTPGYRTSSSPLGKGTISKHTGSNSWWKGKWWDSPRSRFQGKPHSLLRCMPPLPWDKRMS
jgi:hypothetical protein